MRPDSKVVMDKIMPPIEEPEDLEWIKHIKIKSDLLSEFWGKRYVPRCPCLLCQGFDEHPEAKYPINDLSWLFSF